MAATNPSNAPRAVAHFNHRLRGEAADADAAFVQELCRNLDLPCFLAAASDDQLSQGRPGQGWEAAARSARYAFLQQAAEQWGARYLVTGHTRDDQVETILHHILRGSGLQGTAGIPAIRRLSPAVTLLRPTLPFTRAELLGYLHEHHQDFRSDETNQQLHFVRNRIRHELLPLLRERYYPSVDDALLNLAASAIETQASLRVWANSLLDEALHMAEPEGIAGMEAISGEARVAGQEAEVLRCQPLRTVPRHVVREAFVLLWQRRELPRQAMNRSHWQQLAALVKASAPSQIVLPGNVTARREADVIVVTWEGRPR